MTYGTLAIRRCALQCRNSGSVTLSSAAKLQNLPSGVGIHVCHRHTCLRPPEAQLWWLATLVACNSGGLQLWWLATLDFL
ncbi:MAG: hypothetical protein SCH70_10980 [Candidatus Methanoperedens sp.]|nr:hypothetical protein [Candidatus Methanoperedens sp.]